MSRDETKIMEELNYNGPGIPCPEIWIVSQKAWWRIFGDLRRKVM